MGRADRTSTAVLGALSLGRLSGYDIRKLLARSTAHFWTESYGQIYPILRRLEARRLVKSRERPRRGRARRLYALTAAGRAALGRWLDEAPQPQPPRNELLLKVFFGRHAPAGALIRHLTQHRETQAALGRRYRQIATGLKRDHAGHPDLGYWLLTLELGRSLSAVGRRWAGRALAKLGRSASKPRRRSKVRRPREAAP